jgi:hypothetical protein
MLSKVLTIAIKIQAQEIIVYISPRFRLRISHWFETSKN